MFRKIMKNIILLVVSIGASYLIYAVIGWTIDKCSQFFGRESAIGSIAEKALFWLSPLGMGVIIFPVLVIIMFLVFKKLWTNYEAVS